MDKREPRVSAAEIAWLVALVAWAAFSLVLLLVHAAQTHTSFTGADGLIGADGVLGADQLQYLAWARDAGAHGLASDLFSLTPSGHVYLEPLFTISGLLWRIGLSLPLAYLLWKPVAVIGLWLAAVAWARRAFPDRRGAGAATAVLALFLYTPLIALFTWTGLGSGHFRFQLFVLGDELFSASKLWGYAPSALAMALAPTALLAAERALDPYRGSRPAHRALLRKTGRGPLLAAFLAALLASWLHPWQGINLTLIFIALAIWQREEGGFVLLLVALGAALPLGYFYVLSHTDPAWQLASHNDLFSRVGPLVLLAGLGPLVPFVALGVRWPGRSVFEQAILLWVVACFVDYFVNNAGHFAPHALQGLSFPLAVLAVRGWHRLRLPAVLAGAVLLLVTVPGIVYDARKFAQTAAGHEVQYYLPSADARALRWITSRAPLGGILAPTPFAAVIPSQTGRQVWVGHGYWSRAYVARSAEADALFRGRMRPAQARRFVRASGAELLLADCAHRRDLSPALGTLLTSVHRFGCARVYVLGLSVRR